jgi:hypothetical protein
MVRNRKKAELILFRRQALNSGLLVERKIWGVPKSNQYPHAVKYRLVLTDPKEHVVILLYDNHWPKGPHVHWDDKERTYEYRDLATLLEDFLQECGVEERRYHENKKNPD